MTIKVKLLGGTAPMRMTEGSIGYDCFARTKEEIYYKGELVQVKYRLGFAIQLPRDVAGVIAPRSNAIKYICRAGRKDKSKELEDLQKAKNYLEREIERISQNEN